MYKVYFFTVDGGDGSASVDYTDDPEYLDRMTEEDPESYGANEGYALVLSFPNQEAARAAGLAV